MRLKDCADEAASGEGNHGTGRGVRLAGAGLRGHMRFHERASFANHSWRASRFWTAAMCPTSKLGVMTPTRFTRRRKLLLTALGLYSVLWLITATWGTSDIDWAFDRDIAVGYSGFASVDHPPKPEPVVRVPYSVRMQSMNDSGAAPTDRFWRAKSRGIAIAPFVIVDAAAWIDGSLSGFSGYRVTFWSFGASRWFPLRVFWVS